MYTYTKLVDYGVVPFCEFLKGLAGIVFLKPGYDLNVSLIKVYITITNSNQLGNSVHPMHIGRFAWNVAIHA